MEYEGKNKSPYHGLLLSSIMLLLVPIFCTIILYFAFIKTQKNTAESMCFLMALGFGGMIGTLFNISCALAGLYKGTLSVILIRISKLFSNLAISFKYAMKQYFNDLITNGFSFWVYLLVLIINIAMMVVGFVLYIINYFQL